MPGSEGQPLLLCAAFWVALLAYRGRAPLRFVVGLALGALCAHLGWALLRADVVAAHPSLLLDPWAGYCVLFVPLGVLLAAPRRESEGGGSAFLSDALRALPLALAVARLGCLLMGCCGGIRTDRVWPSRHPVALYDIAGLAILHFALGRTPRRLVAPVFCVGFGILRLLSEPLRAGGAPGDPLLPVTVVAGLWVALGLLLSLRPLRPGRLASCAVSSRAIESPSRSPVPRPPHMGDR